MQLGITDDIGDGPFTAGQFAGAEGLHDKGTTTNGAFQPNWDPAFLNGVHGMIIVAGDCQSTVDERLLEATSILQLGGPNATCHDVLRLHGAVRPGDQNGHEQYVLDNCSVNRIHC